ncbi:MAG: hypothetical protein IPJ93_13745 [Bacteroidota bacterium]|nr:MAG: hypothetical protein IPJ93_13745 [Bacteroidota bacterium]
MKQISQQTLSQSEQSTNEMRKQVEEMSEILKNKVGDLQAGQETLLTKQSQNLQVSDSLLSAFNTSIEKMNYFQMVLLKPLQNSIKHKVI